MIVDVSENQSPGTVPFADYDGAIIRAGTGQFNIREDTAWRQHFNACVGAGKPLGLYWFAGHDPANEALFFNHLVSFLVDPPAPPGQVHFGFYCDAEQGQNAQYLDQFRAAVHLPYCGVYGSLSDFNDNYPDYLHFGLNWLAWPSAPYVPPNMIVPDHVLRQTGQDARGLDVNTLMVAQPYPPAWKE